MTGFSPLFIISLPRSGSTLLQRILSTSQEVETCSEPWVALPICYMLKSEGISSEYGKDWESIAINEFLGSGLSKDVFYQAAHSFLMELYSMKVKSSARYFLDKTPRYYLVLDVLKNIFPQAKFIILLRNPLSIVSSSINSWGKKGYWNIHGMKIDLYKGVRALVKAVKNDGVYILHYEDLVGNAGHEMRSLAEYLCLNEDSFGIEGIGEIVIDGELGDPTGVEKHGEISDESVRGWPDAFCNPLRRMWARRYLRKIGKNDLATLGYVYDDLLESVGEVKGWKYLAVDVVKMVYGLFYTFLDVIHFKNKYKKCRNVEDVVGYR